MKNHPAIYGICLLTLFALSATAQKETANWFFGDRCGLSWQDDMATAVFDGKILYREGVSSASDCRGNLLLYTDGKTVWNRRHLPMPNGTDLIGHYSAVQGATIVQQPGQCDLFYIFTLDGIEHHYADGLHYSVIDLSLDGGLGDVIEKNIFLYKPASEKLTAVRHANGVDVWIITHKMDSNEFVTFLLTESGIDPVPVISATGSALFHIEGIGQMKASPDGKRLAFVTMYPKGLQLFDFDDATGQVSRPRIIDVATLAGDGTYGLEFSPNSGLLYFTQYNLYYLTDPGYLYQIDLEAGTPEQILASAVLVGVNPPLTDMRGLQLGPDGKIYVSRSLGTFLGVIRSPDTRGMDCDYVDLGVSLGDRVAGWSLPNFEVTYFRPGLTTGVEAGFEWAPQRGCIEEPVSFFYRGPIEEVLFHWDFGDGGISVLPSPTHHYHDNGTYDVTLITTKACCRDTATQVISVINCKTDVYVPNAFSPNGDGINDILVIYGPTIVDMRMAIFDRWGENLFETTDPDTGWNGQFKDKPMTEGIYVYTLKVSFESGEQQQLTGEVTLMR